MEMAVYLEEVEVLEASRKVFLADDLEGENTKVVKVEEVVAKVLVAVFSAEEVVLVAFLLEYVVDTKVVEETAVEGCMEEVDT